MIKWINFTLLIYTDTMLIPQLIMTGDGSHSLYRADLDESYHSVHGAITESMHVFIRNGFMMVSKPAVRIFEMGFGTGLNALLTLLKARETGQEVQYYSIEKYPLSPELINALNYTSILFPGESRIFRQMHTSGWDSDVRFGNFTLHKIKGDLLQKFTASDLDLVYYDAFSPQKQPELWSLPVLKILADSMNREGIFVTYTARGEVRRNLKAAGFRVERLAGPPGKKHMIRAFKY